MQISVCEGDKRAVDCCHSGHCAAQSRGRAAPNQLGERSHSALPEHLWGIRG